MPHILSKQQPDYEYEGNRYWLGLKVDKDGSMPQYYDVNFALTPDDQEHLVRAIKRYAEKLAKKVIFSNPDQKESGE